MIEDAVTTLYEQLYFTFALHVVYIQSALCSDYIHVQLHYI